MTRARLKTGKATAPLGIRIIGAAALILAFLAFAPLPASAKYASFVMDADTGEVLHETNADTRNYPASLTKMMTLYLTFEALAEGRLQLYQELPISARAERQAPSRLGLPRGSSISVRDAILALVTKSANDVAVAVAEALGGTERKFALKMTAKARKLGMARTTFRNASGLPNRGQLSTARDMATLALALMNDYPQYYDFFSTEKFTYEDRTYKNHNNLLTKYEGTDGIKTGYIRASGFNVVTSVKRDGRHLIGVVFGGKTARQRDNHMARLLTKGFQLAAASDGEGVRTASTAAPSRTTGAAKKGPGSWAVQVGAYYTFAPAYEAARRAVTRAHDLLGDGSIKVTPLQKGKRTLYRARIFDLTKRQAYRACRKLERAKMGCMEIHLPDGVQVASAEE